MGRPDDEAYFVDSRTEHIAQGDIFRDVPFRWSSVVPEGVAEVGFDGFGMLITYTSGMMKQPPGTRDYKHPFRLVAPIFSFTMLAEQGLPEDLLAEIRRSDKYANFMYLPAYPDEFEESAVLPYRPTLVEHESLEGNRVTQLQGPAAVQLQLKLATTFLGGKWNAEDLEPDLTDHWNP
jgi:hypothetical protein